MNQKGRQIRANGDFRTKIFSILKLMKTQSAFACSGKLDTVPNPALCIPPLGTLGLPLSTADAQKIISLASQSPFGRGEETLIDTTVRKSWELNPNQFSLKNPAWNNVMKRILNFVTMGLGLGNGTGSVSAELYKLLLYEPGAFFKPHKDSEKTPGMFATLVVCLPSPHEGGKLVLTHENEKYEFETSSTSDSDYSCAVWFSDITHEVLPVVSGYRLMLTYNIIRQTGFEIPSYNFVRGHLDQLSTLFEQYNLELEAKFQELPLFLLHKLEHKYTKASLEFSALKPRDVSQVQALRKLSTEVGFDIYLAFLELKIERDDSADDIEERSSKLENIIELDGELVVEELDYPNGILDLKTSALLDPAPQGEGKADREVHKGWTGNLGCLAYYWYRDTVVVLVPPSKHLNFEIRSKLKNSKTLEGFLPSFNNLWQEYSQDPAQTPMLEELCELALEQKLKKSRYETHSKSIPPYFQQVAATVLDLGRLDLFDTACEMTENKIIPENARMLGRWTAKKGITAMTDRLMKGLRVAPSIAEKVEFLKSVDKGFRTAVPKPDAAARIRLKQWSDEAIFTASAELSTLTQNDGKSLAQLCKTVDWNQFESKAKPIISKVLIMIKVAFTNELMSTLQQPNKKQRPFIGTIIRSIWDEFVFVPECSEPVPQASSSVGKQTNPVYELLHLIENTIKIFSTGYLETTIIPAMLAAIPTASKESSKKLFIPLAQMILKNFELPTNLVPPALHKNFVQALLTKFLLANVGPEPQAPTDWSLSPRPCKCKDCSVVNEFLQDPDQEIFDLKCPQARREHLTEKFNDPSTVSITIIKERRPFVWRITKHREAYKAAQFEWTKNFNDAVQTLSELTHSEPAGKLEAYLQPYYNIIMTASINELPDLQSLIAMPLLEPNENVVYNQN